MCHLFVFAVLNWLLGTFLLVNSFAILLGRALALFGVLCLTFLLWDLVAFLVLDGLASLVGDLGALLGVVGLAHLVLFTLVPVGRLTLFPWHSIAFLRVHRIALVVVGCLKLENVLKQLCKSKKAE